MNTKLLLASAGLALTINAGAQNIEKIQPEFWYSGMNCQELQILIYGQDIAKCKASINTPLVTKVQEQRVVNKNYLFLNLTIANNAQPGTFEISLQDSTSRKKKPLKTIYELKPKTKISRGFSDKDLMYMIMPDRFANGDPTNDNIKGMLELSNNNDPNGRHGGDIKGIADNVDYMKNLGITALWINPLLENDMQSYSYHGYAITDFYKVDRRFGTNDDYKALSQKLHNNGIKLVMDMVLNHCGSNNFIFKDLPDSTWFHFWPEFTRSNYRGTVCIDPYAAESDKKLMLNGWFDSTMPDINQENPLFMKYLIQNSIWWTEFLGLDAIRMDTYPYNDKKSMQQWAKALHDEFPDMSLLGEVWLNDNPFTTYFANNVKNLDGYTSGLDHVTDFPLTFAINKAFNEPQGWDTGLARIYQSFVSDFLLPHPEKNVIFIDNHDVNRIASDMKGDINKLKMIYGIILTARGIPCIYYGSEIAMESPKPDDGWKRQNMPGGWAGDTKDVFHNKNLTDKESEIFNFISKLANFRKKSPAFSGKMIHFIPQDGIYVYFRICDSQRIMVIINNNDNSQKLETSRFDECIKGASSGTEILSGKKIDMKNIETMGKSVMVVEF